MAERLVWTPADGSAPIDLTDEGSGYVWQAEGTRGLRSVSYSFAAQSYAGIDGDEVQAVRADANHISLGMLVRARTVADLRERSRALVRSLRPKAGQGLLTVTTEDGRARTLACYYEGGAEGDESDDTLMPGRWWRLILKFYAPDPWWYGPVQTVSLGLGAPTVFFPIFPLRLSASTVQGAFTVDLSDTDAPIPPVWTINGPGSQLVLTNQTTGEVIQVNAPVGAGETLIIDTRPGYQSVRRGDGTNLMSTLASDPAMWQLLDGVNRVSAVLTGATSDSRITGAYMPRYAGA